LDIDLKKYIRSVPDFPKKGIVFRDITTLLKDKDALWRAIVEIDAQAVNARGQEKLPGTSNANRKRIERLI